ncbi:hypothetical chloroplast RF20 (plastid) [Cryptomonas paramecium]|uniref:Hypothetical chloroplast RF20 n=1 Tax=Cryptomonas paramaecium TaxID=2898 RepID=D2ISD0_9CRYP|nr:hypothetical chloroplast RF20 [Cryptomonas paramecium]ACT46822.1 hypothetical chloroplast RF20 [Cryptomonas paramecium]BDA97973.1 hypothetical protein [Cryptomonas paramecium]
MRKQQFAHQLIQLLINFILILFGCFIATTLSTTLGQTGDWGMLISGIIVTFLEIISKRTYTIKKLIMILPKNYQSHKIKYFVVLLNDIKIGVLYGFFIEAFKLGS